MLGCVSAHIPWNAISNLELPQSYNALWSELVLPSASTLSNICRREYTLTVDAIKKQLPSRNKVSLALEGWTSTNKLAITSVIAYYMDRNWALREVQWAFDEVDSPFFPISKAHSRLQVNGQHTGAWLAGHLNEVLDRFEQTDGRLVGITTDNASSNYLMTGELQTPFETSGIEWPALRNHIPCMADVIQLALGAFMSSLGVKGRTKSWEAHERDQQFGENESTDIGKSRRLRKEGNATINKVSAMRPGLANIIEKVRISTYFESADADLHIAENACGIDYPDTWTSKRVH